MTDWAVATPPATTPDCEDGISEGAALLAETLGLSIEELTHED